MKSKKNDIIGIKVEPLLGLMGAFRYAKDDWGTVAYIIDRSLLENPSINFLQEELQFNSIYFLVGSIGMAEKIYVGQAKKRITGDSVIPRLREHAKSSTEPYRHVWKYAIALTNANDTWGPTELNALEHLFYNLLPQEVVLNGNNPNAGGAIEYAVYEEKVRQIKAYLTAIGLRTFSNTEDAHKIQVIEEKSHGKVEDLHKGLSSIPEIVTPNYVVKPMIDMLPNSVWNDETVFLDPACKGGEFLRAVFDKLMNTSSLKVKYKSDLERAIHILDKQLYGIALSEVSKDRTVRALNGYDKNIKVIKYYIDILKNKTGKIIIGGEELTVKEYIAKEFNRVDMNFDVVIGNPPYNETTGGGNNGGMPLYQYFVKLAYDLTDRYSSMIIPCRWYTESQDRKYTDIRKLLLSANTKEIHDFENVIDMFKGVHIAGGVCYYLSDKRYEGMCSFHNQYGKTDCADVIALDAKKDFIRHKEMRSIISKTLSYGEKTLDTKVSNTAPFGFKRAYRGVCYKTEKENIRLISSEFDTFVSINDISKNRELVGKYKVYTGYTQVLNNGELASVGILKPNEVCTLTYIIISSFDNLEDAQKFEKYIKTKFVRALIKEVTSTLGVTAKNYRLVPDPDLTSSSDIDWSQSISDIDNQLYKKYNLSPEEIAYIEKTIKPMN